MLNIIYEDKYIIIINKQNNLIVNNILYKKNKTLVDLLNEYYPNIVNVERNGIIHRLDKNTTGLLVVAKTNMSYKFLINSFLKKKNIKEYITLVSGLLISGGNINSYIKRDFKNKMKMKVSNNGKYSITHYRIIDKFNIFTLLKVILYTGRTHQIRVHMSYINHPIIGDFKYGKNISIFDKSMNFIKKRNINFNRQALHSSKLIIQHPVSNKFMHFYSEIPKDMMDLIKILKK
ncbi:pseudouridine synthase [endosymbiont of Sipalinus gigas]|uniref:RluA family pseudouridine synthase n=1 Tax=endosymbiont of Sipalinus gigas TaxID=1972134 RepID=UPI000DC71DC3|nr:RluA family pseudouridine synthase [endosymbiont of Sipalinus gigas]BBA85211.1 pseudouridine synthase [endosymbiont of Sipalinus gigas]